MTDVKQLRETLRGVACDALANQPSASRAEAVCAELTSVFIEELDRMEAVWCGHKGRWGPLPAAARARLAAHGKGKKQSEPEKPAEI